MLRDTDRLRRLPPAQIALLATMLVSALGLGLLMWLTSGAVPRADEWATPGEYLIAKGQHQATFQNLFRQHNESRVIFAQLLAGAIATVWGWNQHILHFLNWVVMVLTGVLYWQLLRVVQRDRPVPPFAVAIAAACMALIFSPVQWRNFLSSGQIITLVVPTLVLAGLLVNMSERIPLVLRYAAAAVLSLVASFSFVNGLLLWFILWPALGSFSRQGNLRLTRAELGASALYFGLTIAVIGAFFSDYHTPPGHPSLVTGLLSPLKATFFTLTWLAGPLFPEHVLFWAGQGNFLPFRLCAVLAGLTALGFLLFLLTRRQQVREREFLLRAYPFWVLLTYSVVSGAAIALARVEFGLFGNASRYSTVAVPAFLGAGGLVWLIAARNEHATRSRIGVALAGVSIAAVLASATAGYFSTLIDKHDADQARLTLAFGRAAPENPLLINVYPDKPTMLRLLDSVRELNLLPDLPDLSGIAQLQVTRSNAATAEVRIGFDADRGVIQGRIQPPGLLEQDDILIIWDITKDAPVTALVAPTADAPYPGRPPGEFLMRIHPQALEPWMLKGPWEVRIARPREGKMLAIETRSSQASHPAPNRKP